MPASLLYHENEEEEEEEAISFVEVIIAHTHLFTETEHTPSGFK